MRVVTGNMALHLYYNFKKWYNSGIIEPGMNANMSCAAALNRDHV